MTLFINIIQGHIMLYLCPTSHPAFPQTVKEMTDLTTGRTCACESILRTDNYVFCSVPQSIVYFVQSLEPLSFR